MYHADQPPAHFHVQYEGTKFLSHETGEVLDGSKLPAKAARIVRNGPQSIGRSS
jgi:hypothetical protein